jgi:hypothetical protein
MSEPNGAAESGNERLDRIERVLSSMPDYHIQFRKQHELLTRAQVQMQSGLEELRKAIDSLARKMDGVHQKFDQPLKRIE